MLSLRQLITEVAQELLTPGDARLIFHALRFGPIHHAKNGAALGRFGDNNLALPAALLQPPWCTLGAVR
jgi:hypothetical protein